MIYLRASFISKEHAPDPSYFHVIVHDNTVDEDGKIAIAAGDICMVKTELFPFVKRREWNIRETLFIRSDDLIRKEANH